jgi:predicted ribosome quality control (RQC) complex YloA/Tae2 family protein
MSKTNISSLELAAIANELQFLVKGKFTQIYHQEKKELLFQLHARNEGKQLLKIIPGKYVCITKNKDAPLKPSSFCMQLRKYIANATINKIYQQEADRVLVFELEKAEKFNLIVELYSKGNLIMTDSDYKIIAALERQKIAGRLVKVGEPYTFPIPKIDWKAISEKDFSSVIKKSDKKNIATTLATELGLGGLYAEEVCKLSEIEKGVLPGDVSSKDVKIIFKNLKSLLEKIKTPAGFIYEEQITPFPLLDQKEVKKVASYSAALDTLDPFKVISPYEKRIRTIERMIAAQEKATGKQDKAIELNTKKGELVYEKYADLQKLLDFVKVSCEEGMEWREIGENLKQVKKINKIDLKNKKIKIEL